MPEWLAGALQWLFSQGGAGNDLTLLSIVFSVNAGFSAIDSLMEGMLRPVREEYEKSIGKYDCEDFIKSVGNARDARSATRRELLQEYVEDLKGMKEDVANLFWKTSRTWKIVMACFAGAALVCIMIPYTGRIVIIGAAPILVFMARCEKEKKDFEKEFRKRTGDIEELKAKMLKMEEPGEQIESRIVDMEKGARKARKPRKQTQGKTARG